MKWLIPNFFTAIRPVLAIWALSFALRDEWNWAFAIFAAAGLTDVIDGPLARGLRVETRLGKQVLEPIADTVYGACGMIALYPAAFFSGLTTTMALAPVAILTLASGLGERQSRFPAFKRLCLQFHLHGYGAVAIAGNLFYGLKSAVPDSTIWMLAAVLTPIGYLLKSNRFHDRRMGII